METMATKRNNLCRPTNTIISMLINACQHCVYSMLKNLKRQQNIAADEPCLWMISKICSSYIYIIWYYSCMFTITWISSFLLSPWSIWDSTEESYFTSECVFKINPLIHLKRRNQFAAIILLCPQMKCWSF